MPKVDADPFMALFKIGDRYKCVVLDDDDNVIWSGREMLTPEGAIARGIALMRKEYQWK